MIKVTLKKVKITQKVFVFSSSEEKEGERNDEEDKYLYIVFVCLGGER